MQVMGIINKIYIEEYVYLIPPTNVKRGPHILMFT